MPGQEMVVVNPFRGVPEFLDRSEFLDAKAAVLKLERHRLIQFLPPVRIEVPASKVDDITRVMNRYLSEWPAS